MRIMNNFILMISATVALVGAEGPVAVPDPFGLGERLAIIDFLREKRVALPADPTLEVLRALYLKASGTESPPGHDDATERDRRSLLRSALQKDYGITAPESASEADLSRLLMEKRQEREEANRKAMEHAATGEVKAPSSAVPKNWVTITYDERNNSTVLQTPIRLAADRRTQLEGTDSSVSFTIFLAYKDMDLSQPSYLGMMMLHCSSRQWRLKEHHDVTLQVDGVRIDLGKSEHDGTPGTNNSVREHVKAAITEQQIALLAKAQNIAGKVGALDLIFDGDARADIAALAGVVDRLRRSRPAMLKDVLAKSAHNMVRMDCATLDKIYAEAQRGAAGDGANAGASPAVAPDPAGPQP